MARTSPSSPGASASRCASPRPTATIPRPPTIEPFVGGAPVAALNGPAAEIEIDTSTLPPGPTLIRAVSRDDAGNRSVSAKVVIDVQ